MKMRIACLAALPALLLPLASCLRRAPEIKTAPGGSAVKGAPIQGLAVTGLSKDWSPVGPANFPHDKHAQELGIECAQCHHETDAKPLAFPHPEYLDELWIDCAICHRKAGSAALGPQACSACHREANGDAADETLSAKVVIHKNCWSCHEVGTGKDASATCKLCHTPRS